MEIFKGIPGWEDYYEASNLGNVKSLERIVIFGKGVEKLKKESILKHRINRNGYPAVNLCRDGKSKQIENHRLVALTFIDNPENKPSVNHINGIKTDNRLENLEWATWKEQSKHAWDMGLQFFGDKQREAFENANRNRVVSDETKQKMRDACKLFMNDDYRRKMSEIKKGQKAWNKGMSKLDMENYRNAKI